MVEFFGVVLGINLGIACFAVVLAIIPIIAIVERKYDRRFWRDRESDAERFFGGVLGSFRISPPEISDYLVALAWGFSRYSNDSKFGELWKASDTRIRRDHIGISRGATLLRANPNDPHEVWIPVPPECETPKEAVAWTYDIAPGEYNPYRT